MYVFAVNKKWNMLLLLREWWSSVSSWCGLTPLPIASVVPVEVNDKLRHQVSMNTSHKWLHIFFIMCLATFSGNEIFCWINTHWATILVEIMKIFDSFENIVRRSVLRWKSTSMWSRCILKKFCRRNISWIMGIWIISSILDEMFFRCSQ